MYQLKELLGLVVYKGERHNQHHLDSSASQNVSIASASSYKVENTNLKTLAVDIPDNRQDSFDMNASFAHTFQSSLEKLSKVFTLC